MTWHNIPTVILLEQHYMGKLAVPSFSEISNKYQVTKKIYLVIII